MRLQTVLCALFFVAVVLLVPRGVVAAPIADKSIPPELLPWKAWALYGEEYRLCPSPYNDPDAHLCVFPSRLGFDLSRTGGSFSMQVLVLAETWVGLPGGPEQWPARVTVDTRPVAVVGRGPAPFVRLMPGRHVIGGFFDWQDLPEVLIIPSQSGLVTLSLNDTAVLFPVIEGGNRLWLQKRAAADAADEEMVEVKIFRRLRDAIPFRVETMVRLNVSGRQREVRLDRVLLDKAVPLGVQSPLPLRFGPDGQFLIQVRPGTWDLYVEAWIDGPVRELGPLPADYGQEVWAFEAQSRLRMVSIEGPVAVDPQRTELPEGWRRLPCYLMPPGAVMTLRETRRGDPDPAPDQLNLERTWWLDFDGGGFTVRDRLTGAMSRQWYLAVNPPMQLGRVVIDGADQLITSQGPEKKPGVELRRGRLDLEAESRVARTGGAVPAVGWDHDVQSVSATLNLPPGWKIFAARGVDSVPGTWFARWTLLDFFIALIITMAIWKLYGSIWGLAGLAVMALTYHEPGAPRLVWLSILAAAALLRVLPENRLRKIVQIWRIASIVVLIVLSVPFAVRQVRWAVYPQLDSPRGLETAGFVEPRHAQLDEVRKMAEVQAPVQREGRAKQARGRDSYVRGLSYDKESGMLGQDPKALIQTGPGLPSWRWRSYVMKWSGPFTKDHRMRLWLLSPGMNLVLNFARVALLVLLILGVAELKKLRRLSTGALGAVVCALLLCCAHTHAADDAVQGCPPDALVQQLRERLLERSDCFPQCADCARMQVSVQSGRIAIVQEISAALDSAVPLPGHVHAWSPDRVLLDGQPADGLARGEDGLLWVFVPAGAHRLIMGGRAPAAASFQLQLPLKPRMARLGPVEGWDVQGIDSRGQAQPGLQFTRIGRAEQGAAASAAGGIVLPPFFSVERVLKLGLAWQVHTTVTRLSPAGAPAALAVPLLEGESVTSAGVRVEQGRALVTLDAASTRISWSSSLAVAPGVVLQAPVSVPWVETWVLDASPIWHCAFAGIPVVHHQDRGGYWKPRWQPWPGESVTIEITRPAAIEGQTITVDDARLTLTPGKRIDSAALSLALRASRGAEHTITLPEGSRLQKLAVDGTSQPVKEQQRKVVLSLQPGTQTIELAWNRQAHSRLVTRAPAVDIGIQAVNAAVTFMMPVERWILLAGGPRLGPAVLFWSYCIVIVLAALLLAKIPGSPLSRLQWVLLGLGLTQVSPVQALIVVGWLLALERRRTQNMPEDPVAYNSLQVVLVVWTLASLVCLYAGVERGLLYLPDMQIAGNGSSATELNWLQDRIDGGMPRPWVLSLPLLAYRVLMLVWSLWLALSLLKWLRRGWGCFSTGGAWKKRSRKAKSVVEAK